MDIPILLVCFSALLVAGVLLSELANRTVLSTAVLFLVAGFLRSTATECGSGSGT